jgi:hypothetical protein
MVSPTAARDSQSGVVLADYVTKLLHNTDKLRKFQVVSTE